MFGLTQKDTASWVLFDVEANEPIDPPVTIGDELQAVVTVEGQPGQADVECEADVPTWTDEAGWLEFVRVQRNAFSLDTIDGRYPYPGGPGYAVPSVGHSFTAGVGGNLLTEDITVAGASVRFETDATRFTVVSGSPQDLENLAWEVGSDLALDAVLAIDPDFEDTLEQCRELPPTATPEALDAAVAALGSVWGIDVDEAFPPASSSVEDRCLALDEAQAYYFNTAARSLTVGWSATVVLEETPPPTTTTTSTSTSTTTTSTTTTSTTMPTTTTTSTSTTSTTQPTTTTSTTSTPTTSTTSTSTTSTTIQPATTSTTSTTQPAGILPAAVAADGAEAADEVVPVFSG
jgi:hypothetical protein